MEGAVPRRALEAVYARARLAMRALSATPAAQGVEDAQEHVRHIVEDVYALLSAGDAVATPHVTKPLAAGVRDELEACVQLGLLDHVDSPLGGAEDDVPGVESGECLVRFLPSELLLEVFSHLDAESLRVVRRVCREWRAISSEPQLYRLLCARLGLVDPPSAPPLPAAAATLPPELATAFGTLPAPAPTARERYLRMHGLLSPPRAVHALPHMPPAVRDVVLTRGQLFSCAGDNVWVWRQRYCFGKLRHSRRVTGVYADGDTLATVCEDGGLRIFAAAVGEERGCVRLPGRRALQCVTGHVGFVCAGGEDGVVWEWSTTTLAEKAVWNWGAPVRALDTGASYALVSGDDSGAVRVVDVRVSSCGVASAVPLLWRPAGDVPGRVRGVLGVSAHATVVAAACADGRVAVYDVRAPGAALHMWEAAHQGGATCVCVRGDVLLSGGADGVVRAWVLGGGDSASPSSSLFTHADGAGVHAVKATAAHVAVATERGLFQLQLSR